MRDSLARIKAVLAELRRQPSREGAEDTASFASSFDLADPDLLHNPFPPLRELRESGPVHHLPRNDCYLIVAYDEAKTALSRPDVFSSRCLEGVDPVLLGADPPVHSNTRRALSRYFSPDALVDLTDSLQARAEALVKRRFDVVSDYAVPLTRSVTSALVGLSPAEVGLVIAEWPGSRTGGRNPEVLAETVKKAALFNSLLDNEQAAVTEGEAGSLVALLCAASSETVERLIIQSALLLLKDRKTLDSLAADRALIVPFVEEVLRLFPSEPLLVRQTLSQFVLGGVAIPSNARVHVSLAAANRDPAHFDRPDQVTLDGSRKAHLAFGGGAHHCIGAGLGRRVAATAIRCLLGQSGTIHAGEPLEDINYHSIQGLPVPQRLMIST